MTKWIKIALAVATAASALGIAVGMASGNRLAGNLLIGRARLASLEFTGGGATVRCPVTLEGSLHSRTVSKIAELLIGYVTRGTVGTCTGGNARINTETLPWHERYVGFTGVLPRIETIRGKLIRPSWTIAASAIPVPCRYTAAEITRTAIVEANGTITGGTFTKSNIASETFGCPGTNEMKGTGTIESESGGPAIVTLVA